MQLAHTLNGVLNKIGLGFALAHKTVSDVCCHPVRAHIGCATQNALACPQLLWRCKQLGNPPFLLCLSCCV